jgi:hypothetical protein
VLMGGRTQKAPPSHNEDGAPARAEKADPSHRSKCDRVRDDNEKGMGHAESQRRKGVPAAAQEKYAGETPFDFAQDKPAPRTPAGLPDERRRDAHCAKGRCYESQE